MWSQLSKGKPTKPQSRACADVARPGEFNSSFGSNSDFEEMYLAYHVTGRETEDEKPPDK